MSCARALTLFVWAIELAGCATVTTKDEPLATVAPVAETSGAAAETRCEGQDEDFGCYAVPEAVPEAGGLVVESSGPSAKGYPSGLQLSATNRIILKPGDTVRVLTRSGLRTFSGPGTYLFPGTPASQTKFAYLTSPRTRVRSGAIRGGPDGPQPGPRMLVIRGDPVALGWYGLGRRLPVAARVCLPPNAQFLTLQRTDGGLVTYGGGGCNKAAVEPDTGDGETGAGRGL